MRDQLAIEDPHNQDFVKIRTPRPSRNRHLRLWLLLL